jgi:hypothetical protein
MKQILHIFIKDTRHLWSEILVSLALTATLVLTYPAHWRAVATMNRFNGSFGLEGGPLNLLSEALVALIPLSWWLLISPAIHSERLVGDQQFWLTRPYEWKKLLAAKALFLVVFLYLPIFVAQSLLLVRAGFHPLPCLPGVVYNLLQITGVLVLPLVALATVTKNFGRMTLAVFGAIVCVIGIVALSSVMPVDQIASPYGDRISIVLLICGCITVVVLQYATRNVRIAWLLLIALLVIVGIVTIAAPDQALMNRTFPPATDQDSAGVKFAYREEPGVGGSVFVGRRSNEVDINIPVHVSGVPDGSIAIPNDLKVTIEAADGSHWASAWQPIFMDMFLPGGKLARASFNMPRSVYEKFKSKPLSVRVAFALTQAEVDNVIRIPLPIQSFPVPGFGNCVPETGYAEQPDEISGIACRAPMRQPNLTLIHVIWFDGACHGRMAVSEQGVLGDAWAGSLDQETTDLHLSPVWDSQIQFTSNLSGYRPDGGRHLCPGTPTTFTEYKLDRRRQTSFTIQDFQLPTLSRGQALVMENP